MTHTLVISLCDNSSNVVQIWKGSFNSDCQQFYQYQQNQQSPLLQLIEHQKDR